MTAGPDLKQIRRGLKQALSAKDWTGGVGLLAEWCRQKPGGRQGLVLSGLLPFQNWT